MRKNSPSIKRTHLLLDTFTKLSLSNIMKHGESDVERQISIQGIHLSVFLANIIIAYFNPGMSGLNGV